MRYQQLVKTPCSVCQCPLVLMQTFCCSDIAYRVCKSCGTKEEIPSREAHLLIDTSLYMSKGRLYRHRPLTPEEKDKEVAALEQAKRDGLFSEEDAKLPMETLLKCFGRWENDKITPEEETEFHELMKKYGYAGPPGPQIGFLGNKQVFDPPIQL